MKNRSLRCVFVARPVWEGEAPAEPERCKTAPQERRPPESALALQRPLSVNALR